MQFESLITIAALFGYDPRQFDVSTVHLYGEIDGEDGE
jgi:hypothetical protein